MNLKESFRYQTFLDGLMRAACYYINDRNNSISVTKTHLMNKANPEAVDMTETLDMPNPYPVDSVIKFAGMLVKEKETLTLAIGEAKAGIELDIEAAVAANKFRQQLNSALRSMLRADFRNVRKEQGRAYKFNAEGNQTVYLYDIEVETKEAFDRDSAKNLTRELMSVSDETSNKIESAMINTVVAHTPLFDVNETFEDIMAAFPAE